MEAFDLAKAITQASLISAVQSSVNSDTRLLLASLNAIKKHVDLTLVGHKNGTTATDVERSLLKIFPKQEHIEALVHFVFDCRYGWSERTSDTTGHALDPPAMSMHSPARSGGAAARKRVLMGSVSAQSKKKTLNDAADAMIDVLFELPPSNRILLALQNCTRITTKPVVRQQTLVHFYSWLKHYLRTRTCTNNRQRESSTNMDTSSASTTAVEMGDDMSPVEYECATRLIILSLTDVWSAIRKASSAHLYSVVDLFPMDQVRTLFEELCKICNGTKGLHSRTQQRSGSPTNDDDNRVPPTASTSSISSTASTASSAPKTATDVPSPWQGKNGALMGITVIIKKFRRQTRSTSHRKHPSPTTAWLAAVEDGNSPSGSHEWSSSAKSSLSLNLMTIDASDQSPPASPAGRAQRFNDWSVAQQPALPKTSIVSAIPIPLSTPSTSSTQSTATHTPAPIATSTTTNDQQQNDQSISPLGQHHGGSTLMFGMSYQCDGLPDFICRAIHDVTFNLIGHEQLSVRENATRAFAAFLSRCPAHQTINAFSDVIDRLHRNFQSSLQSERAAYLAEGLLGLCVILAKLRLIPSNYMISNWDHIYLTLEGYLGHPASTVRQMSSTVFKHLAFRASRGMSGLGSGMSRGEDKESYLLLVAILRRLVFRWSLKSSLHTHVQIPIGGAQENYTESIGDGEKGQNEDELLPWQSLEGRLLVYELLVGYLLANHRHFLTLDMTSRAVFAGSNGINSAGPPRRASIHGVAVSTKNEAATLSPSVLEGSTDYSDQSSALRKRSGSAPDLSPLLQSSSSSSSTTTTTSSSSSSSSSLSTPLRPTGGRRNGKVTPGDVMSPDPTASPALSLTAIGSTSGGSVHRSGRSDSAASNRSSIGSASLASTGRRDSHELLQSIVTTLQSADDVILDTSSMFWKVDSNRSVSSSASPVTVRSAFCAVLQMMLLQTKECLASKRFELRRMADQVLKPLSELMFYYAPSTMQDHWIYVSEWLLAKDTLSCRFAAETMLCCIKHSLSLSIYVPPPTSPQESTSIFDASESSSSGMFISDGGEATAIAATTATTLNALNTLTLAENSNNNNNSSSSSSNVSTVNDQWWDRRHAEQRKCLLKTLQRVMPAFHNLAKKAVSERLAAAIFELMVVVHSLFDDSTNEVVNDLSSNTSDRLRLPERQVKDNVPPPTLSLPYPRDAIRQHLDIVLGRVINIHELANNSQRKNGANGDMSATTSKKAAAALLRKRRRAIALDPALATALIPHLPTLLSNRNTTARQQLQLLPIVLRWTLMCDAVDARVSLLDTVSDIITKPAMSTALQSVVDGKKEETTHADLLMASVEPLCQLVEKSLEAPVLGSVLDVILSTTSILPAAKVPVFLSKVLPSAAKRLKQAAPQVCYFVAITAALLLLLLLLPSFGCFGSSHTNTITNFFLFLSSAER